MSDCENTVLASCTLEFEAAAASQDETWPRVREPVLESGVATASELRELVTSMYSSFSSKEVLTGEGMREDGWLPICKREERFETASVVNV